MSRTRIVHALAVALAVGGFVPTPSVAASDPNCDVDRPAVPKDAGDPNNSSAGRTPGGKTLTERLATCGSVLDPPAVGDPDIVEPTPRTRDPINLHPETPQGDRP